MKTTSIPPELEKGIIGRWIEFEYVLYNKNKDKDPVMEWDMNFWILIRNLLIQMASRKMSGNMLHGKIKRISGTAITAMTVLTKVFKSHAVGPPATIRWDEVKEVNLKWVSQASKELGLHHNLVFLVPA